MRAKIAAIVLVPMLAAAPRAVAQPSTGDLRGAVRSAETQQPVTTAVVRMRDVGRTAAVDADGLFTIGVLRPGTYAIEVSAPGYLPLSATAKIVAGGSERLDLALVPSPRYTEDLVVTASGRP